MHRDMGLAAAQILRNSSVCFCCWWWWQRGVAGESAGTAALAEAALRARRGRPTATVGQRSAGCGEEERAAVRVL